MSLVVENESSLPIMVTKSDHIAVGVGESDLPTLDSCRAVQVQQQTFQNTLTWKGDGKDVVRVVPSPREDRAIVVVAHRVPRFSACTTDELDNDWKGKKPVTRVTTVLYYERGYGLQSGGRSTRCAIMGVDRV